MKRLFKYLFYSSIPGLLFTLFANFQWQQTLTDISDELKDQAATVYQDNKPDILNQVESKIDELTSWGGSTPSAKQTKDCRTYSGKTVGISDGDTITVLDDQKVQHRIRLRGIDAPEKAQSFGDKSKRNLSDLIFSKIVKIETCELDRYQREIGLVILNDQSMNAKQVLDGFAHVYREYLKDLPERERNNLEKAEEYAKKNRLGLWIDPSPILPKDFRKTNKLL